jgi:hypothetical protein
VWEKKHVDNQMQYDRLDRKFPFYGWENYEADPEDSLTVRQNFLKQAHLLALVT